jgi:hypothetical protein
LAALPLRNERWISCLVSNGEKQAASCPGRDFR